MDWEGLRASQIMEMKTDGKVKQRKVETLLVAVLRAADQAKATRKAPKKQKASHHRVKKVIVVKVVVGVKIVFHLAAPHQANLNLRGKRKNHPHRPVRAAALAPPVKTKGNKKNL